MRYLFLPILLAGISITELACASNEDMHGYWVVPGGDAVVEVQRSESGTRIRLAALLDPTLIDSNNPDQSLRKRPLTGIVIGAGFDEEAQRLSGGWIYDPDSGRTYKAELSLDQTSNGQLMHVRGYVGFKALGRTQEWRRLAYFASQIERMLTEVHHAR